MKFLSDPRIIAVSSGKGGVGKTNCVANLAMYFAGINKKVLILDADLGLCNIDVLFGIRHKYNIKHVLNGMKSLKDIILEGPRGIQIIPAGSGIQELTNINNEQRHKLISTLEQYDMPVDVVLIDTGAGIADNVLFFCDCAHEIVVVTTPEPTSITDAYALIKLLSRNKVERNISVLINMARSEQEAMEAFRQIAYTVDLFLPISVNYLDYLPSDPNFRVAIRAQRAFISMFPNSSFARRLARIGEKLMERPLYVCCR